MSAMAGDDTQLISEDVLERETPLDAFYVPGDCLDWTDNVHEKLAAEFISGNLTKRQCLEYQAHMCDAENAHVSYPDDDSWPFDNELSIDEIVSSGHGDEWFSLNEKILELEDKIAKEHKYLDSLEQGELFKVETQEQEHDCIRCDFWGYCSGECIAEDMMSGKKTMSVPSPSFTTAKKKAYTPKKPERAVYACVEGKVQGVCFRAFTDAIATKLGCTGYVKNMPEPHKDVELFAQGSNKAVNALITCLHVGPTSSEVKGVEFVEAEIDESIKTFKVDRPKGDFKMGDAIRISEALKLLGSITVVTDANPSVFKDYGDDAEAFLTIAETKKRIDDDKDLGKYFRQTVSRAMEIPANEEEEESVEVETTS